jgi:hypothetical protein
MYSLHLTGNPWFLLLIPPGLWILWRQYRGGAGESAPVRAGALLFALQAAALILLAFSLTAPEIRRHRVAFHNPTVLILRDQSASFRVGGYLGLGARYRDFEKALNDHYGSRKFDVRVADFAETAWPVRGFAEAKGAVSGPRTEDVRLTSLAAAADFVDSASVPNLQAVFLFTDGRSNLDSSRAQPSWKLPVYPVLFAADSIGEIQPAAVRLLSDEGAAVTAEASWSAVGKPSREVSVKIRQGNRTVTSKPIPWRGAEAAKDGARGEARFPAGLERSVLDGRTPLRAVLQPSGPSADFDPYNDTVDVTFPRGRAVRNIHVLKPIRSLDEKAMLGVLQDWDGTRVSFFAAEEAANLKLSAEDQVWVEAGMIGPQSRLSAWLQSTPARVAVYSRPEAGRAPQLPGLANAAWHAFGPTAEVKAGKAAADAFPDEVVRVKNLTLEPLDLPDASGQAWIEAVEGRNRGMLMGRLDLGRGKHAFYFALPAIWAPLFDPQGDFTLRGNVDGYIKAAQILAGLEDGTVRVSRPARAYDGVPFEFGARLPEAPGGAGLDSGAAVLSVTGGGGYAKEWRQTGRELLIKDMALPAGRYRMELKADGKGLWSDSLDVSPKAALELARIGFDRAALEDAATRSGGTLLEPAAGGQVTSMLPDLPAAQIRMEKTTSIRLYNTFAQCFLVLALLALSWLLRKKWDMD